MQETEADTRANRIDPVLRDAGWGVADGSRVAREEIAKIKQHSFCKNAILTLA